MAKTTVHALDAGHITLPERFFISPNDPGAKQSVPSLSFLIQHVVSEARTIRIIFDLGLRRDVSLYPSALQAHCAARSPITTKPDVVESLHAGGLTVDDIDYVIFSHIHYDHVGYPKDFTNPRTKFIVGSGASDLLSGKIKFPGSHSTFEPDLLPPKRTIELSPAELSLNSQATTATGSDSTKIEEASQPLFKKKLEDDTLNLDTWTSLDKLPHVLDIFGDSSVYIVSAPGHLPGHIALLARTSSPSPSISSSTIHPQKYVLLAGDACHDIRLFNGTHEIGTWTDNQGNEMCIHADKKVAKQTIQLFREISLHGLLVQDEQDKEKKVKSEVEVIFAHNWAWEEEAKRKGRFFPGKL